MKEVWAPKAAYPFVIRVLDAYKPVGYEKK